MRRFNRILGFVAIGFVLVFLGKVNKTGLFTAYFKTIADVEIRNSHSLDFGDAHFVAALTSKASQPLETVPQVAGEEVPSISLPFAAIAQQDQPLPIQPDRAAALGLRCFQDVAPRAPGA